VNVGCPTCGATVEFRFDDSFVRVCNSCRSAVLRTDRGIETLGRMADLVPIASPLKLFAEGRYGDASFLLVGMAQLRHAAGGVWQEWYAKLDGGQWAWLSEAQGRYYLTFERPGLAAPPFMSLRPGAQVTLADRTYTVGEVSIGTYASATGEIPYRLDPKATFQYADLSDGQGGFATIDYGDGHGDGEPAVYVGHQIELAALRLSGGEDPHQGAAAPKQGAKLPCPNCGGSLELSAPDQALRVACPYCNHLVSVQTGNLSVIAKLAQKATPAIALGERGKFAEGEMTVIGYMQRSSYVYGVWYPFDEYLLYAPQIGFRWLVCSDGHWSYVQPVAPGAVELAPVRYDGVTFELFLRTDLRVDQVLGEFYWLVSVGEQVTAEDYIAPPAMLSCETSRTEQTWSLSTYLTPREVRLMFGKPDLVLPAPTGVAPNQPYSLHGSGKVAGLLMTALCVVGIVRCSGARSEVKHTTSVEMPPGTFTPATLATPATPGAADAPAPAEVPANVKFTDTFRLEGGKNVEIQLDASFWNWNGWAYAAIDLVNDKTGSVVSFDKSLEYYSGVTDGESWSEGSSNASQVLGPVDAGEYVMRVETLQSDTTARPLGITVRQDVFRLSHWLIAVVCLGIPIGIFALHSYHFKKKRWDNSQLERSSERARKMFAPIGSDDHSSWGSDDDDD
jgi:DNA-directed RNA polymerase subunit RPC12/RpoP